MVDSESNNWKFKIIKELHERNRKEVDCFCDLISYSKFSFMNELPLFLHHFLFNLNFYQGLILQAFDN